MTLSRLIMFFTAALAACSSVTTTLAQDRPIVLRYAGTIAITHHISKGMVMFSEGVAKRTDGRVKVENYPANTLFKASDVGGAVSSGAVDIGQNITAVWSKTPIADIMDLPFLIRGADHARKAWATDGPLFKAYGADMEKKGMKILHVMLYGSLFDFVNNGRQLRVPGDFNRMKIRSYGALAAESLRTLGATPIVMDPSEYFLALQSGTIDGVITGISSIHAAKLFEVGKFVTSTSAGFAVFTVNVNLGRYNALPDDVRRAIAAAGDEVQAWSVEESKRGDQRSMDFLKSKLQVHVLTQAERDIWGGALEPVTQAWLKRASKEEQDVLEWVRKLPLP